MNRLAIARAESSGLGGEHFGDNLADFAEGNMTQIRRNQ
jgi:hypothetical protein